MRDPYLVLFVLDPAGDDEAAALAQVAEVVGMLHPWEGRGGPRPFDARPAESGERTVGIALRLGARPDDDGPAIAALVGACAVAAERLGVAMEVQLHEERIGELRDGAADPQVVAALRERLGVHLD